MPHVPLPPHRRAAAEPAGRGTGRHVRRFRSIAGRAGSILVAAHYGMVLAAVLVLAGVIQGSRRTHRRLPTFPAPRR